VAVTAWHMAAKAPGDEDEPQEGNGQAREDMDQQAETDVQPDKQPLAPVPPAAVMHPFQNHEAKTGKNSEPMPNPKTGEGNSQYKAAKEDTDSGKVEGAASDIVPAQARRKYWT